MTRTAQPQPATSIRIQTEANCPRTPRRTTKRIRPRTTRAICALVSPGRSCFWSSLLPDREMRRTAKAQPPTSIRIQNAASCSRIPMKTPKRIMARTSRAIRALVSPRGFCFWSSFMASCQVEHLDRSVLVSRRFEVMPTDDQSFGRACRAYLSSSRDGQSSG